MSYTIEDFDDLHIDDPSLHYGTPELNNLTYKIIGASMEIYNTLGKGFSEKAYQDCLCIEFESLGISYEREKNSTLFTKVLKLPITTMLILLLKTRLYWKQRPMLPYLKITQNRF